MSKTYVIVGAGFRGFCDSLQLLNAGHKVIIIDMAPFFGGISYSANVKGFAVDKGVHMFDSIQPELANIVTEIMDGKVREIDFISMSAFNGVPTDGYSLPDLSSLDDATKNQITQELQALAKTGGANREPKTLAEYLDDRYGKTAGGIYANIFKHVYNINASEAQPDAISKTSLGRLKYMDDDTMLKMKASDPWLDNVLAARRKALGKVDDLVSIYPDSGEAMRGWCDRAVGWLEAKGATICLGENITGIENTEGKIAVQTYKNRFEADKVIWTNDQSKALAGLLGFEFDTYSHISGTSMVFATLITQRENIKDFTYLQNFDPDGITYRTASAGIYSGQTREDGASFITCECPAAMDSDTWKNADQMHSNMWEECQALGIINQGAELLDHSIIRAPVTFKVAKIGYDEKVAEFMEEVTKRNDRIIFRNVKPFFRREIFADSFNVPDLVAA